MFETKLSRPAVLVVSLPKCGTYLVERLFRALEFQTERQLLFDSGVELPGQPPVELEKIEAGHALLVHRLTEDRLSERFVRRWQSGDLRVIFHVRDPRDVLVSAVNFLVHKRDEMAPYPPQIALSRVLCDLPTLADRIDYVLQHVTSENFGLLEPMSLFHHCRWLLQHPDVCTTRFERLVGSQGGGTTVEQEAEICRVADYLGTEVHPHFMVDLFSRQAVTFFRGQQGVWRDVLSPAQLKVFYERFGEILSEYGYACH